MAMTLMRDPIADAGLDGFAIDAGDERLLGPGGPIRLGNKAFQVLLRLVERGGRLVTKDELMASVWDGTIVSEFSLTSAIKELRRALDDDARCPRFIESVYGRGYRLLTPIARVDAAPSAAFASSEKASRLAPRGDRPSADCAAPAFAALAGFRSAASPQRDAAAASTMRRSYRRFVALVAALASLAPAATLAYSSRASHAAAPATEASRCFDR